MLHQIGSGVLGPVFRTYDPQHDRLVAVKAFRLDIPPQTVARLADAFRRLVDRPLTHPAVVRVLDGGLEGTAAFLAMEYAPGESLDIALRSAAAPWPIDRALPWLTVVANAIDAAWAEGSRHGALHPRDILLSSDSPDVRVTGFGIASALESIGEKPPVRRPYTAPERLSGQAWDVRADVYSLGVIAHEVLAGRRPAGPGEQDGVFAPGMQPGTRVSLRRVLAAALAQRPEDRFDRATTFVEALAAASRGETPAMPATGPTAPVPVTLAETTTIEVEKADMRSFASEAEDERAGDVPPAPPEVPHVLVRPSAELPPAPQKAPVPPVAAEPPLEAPRTHLLGSVIVPEAELLPPAEPVTPAIERAPKVVAASSGARPAPIARSTERPPSGRATGPLRLTSPDESLTREPLSSHAWQAPPERSRYPWVAIAAALLAGVAIGVAGTYQFGLRRAQTVAQSTAPAASTSARADTDVPVAPPPAASDPAARPAAPANEPPATAPTAVPERPGPPDVQRTSAPRGRLLVRSVPSGALVFVDGRRQGETTPATLRDLPLGSHTVEVAHAGYVPQSEQVHLTASSPARTLTMELKPGIPTDGPRTGSVYLDSRPRGARALIDGRFVGHTPLSVPELSVGEHVVTFEIAGAEPVTSKFAVKAGVRATVAITLK